MKSKRTESQQHGASEAPTTQVERMRAAVEQAVAIGPAFLRGDVDADHMAEAMVRAVRSYVDQERAGSGVKAPRNPAAQELQAALDELSACGSGYLAGRCDAACVARTMSQMVHEFATR